MRQFLVAGLVAGLTTALAVLNPQPAEAKCGSPTVAFSPASGDLAEGTVWVFLPTDFPLGVSALPDDDVGAAIDLDVDVDVESDLVVNTVIDVVSANATFTTVRVDVSFPDSKGDAAFRVIANGKTRDYVLTARAARLKAPKAGPVSLSSPKHVSSSWTCSHDEYVSAVPDEPAHAYEIHWAPTEADYRAGKRESIVVPPNMGFMWGQDANEPHSAPELKLGYLSCFGETVPTKSLHEGTFIGVAALTSGFESPPTDPIEVRAGDTLVFEQVGEPEPWVCGTGLLAQEEAARQEAHVASLTADARPPSPLSIRIALLALFIGMLTGMFVGGTLSRRTLRVLDAHSIPQLIVVLTAIPAALSRTAAGASAFGSAAFEIGIVSFALATAFSVVAGLAQRNR